MTVSDDLAGITSDLASVREMLGWASTMAWWPHGRALDAPAGRALPPRDPDSDPDQVPGPRWATGIGDHKAQAAIQASLVHLRTVESRLYVVAAAMATRRQIPARLPMRRPQPGPLMAEIQWLCATLATPGLAFSDGDRRLVASARRAMDRAWRALDSVISRGEGGPDTHATAKKDRCRICGIRPKADKKARCSTCAKWKVRNGYERPTKLDSIGDAQAAQQRRQARGDSYGDESLSGTDQPPIVTCTCTPDGPRCPNHTAPATKPAECGTRAGHIAHRRRDEPSCDECAEAWLYDRENLRRMEAS